MAFNEAYEKTFGTKSAKYDFWDFGTSAVTPVSMGIPTIGFGPGEYKLAHMLNENVEVRILEGALAFCANVIDTLYSKSGYIIGRRQKSATLLRLL